VYCQGLQRSIAGKEQADLHGLGATKYYFLEAKDLPAVWIAALAVLSALLLVAAAIVIAEKRKCAALSRELKRTGGS
jgi:hypothetical protein